MHSDARRRGDVSSSTPGPARPGFETLFVNNRATSRRLRKAKLAVIDGPDRGKSLVMDKPRITVGRSIICELALTDRSVSGSHAEIEAIESGYVVRDLGSTNGCYLGEVRLREAVVPLGTRIRMGTSTLQFEPADGTVDVPLSQQDRFYELVGRSVAMRQIFAQLEKVAPSDLTVLVTGETGTGKELVARAIHHASRRAKGPLVVQDCSAMPLNLVESTLFGHERGAFTGASDRHIGSFEQANGGTLFLDEVGELPIEQQAKLLRVLEQREIRRVGGEKTIPVDVRVVAATNRDLRVMVSQGQFREDLYYRLGVVTVELPPLRARREDIPLIATAMLAQFCARQPELGPREFAKDTLERLGSLPFAGNVRELRNLVERAASLADGVEITIADLMPAAVTRTPPAGVPALSTKAAESVLAAQQAGVVSDELTQMPFKNAKARVLESFEPAYLRAMLARYDGNITRAANAAGLTRYHLRELCKRYGLRSVDNEPE
jgi:DNA-binding NtrC family response regulator